MKIMSFVAGLMVGGCLGLIIFALFSMGRDN